MNTETIKLSNGYTATVCTDDSPSNPFREYDGEPPMAVHYDGRIYSPAGKGKEITLADLYDEIPEAFFAIPENRAKLFAALQMSEDEISNSEPLEDTAEGWRWSIRENFPEADHWNRLSDYLDAMEAVAGLAGVACLRQESRGYSQGDYADVFLAATPAWLEETGVTPENIPAALKVSFDLYSAWAWGDVYGVWEITRPDGIELDDGACWGFYGSDHEASGLLEHCESAVASDLAYLAKETTASHDAACRDIATV